MNMVYFEVPKRSVDDAYCFIENSMCIDEYSLWFVESSISMQSLPWEACHGTDTHQHTPKSIYMYENSYIQISITNIALYAWKLSSKFIFLIMKILLIFNKNLHNKNPRNNKLYNGLEIRVDFLETSLKFKYFWNITRGNTRE